MILTWWWKKDSSRRKVAEEFNPLTTCNAREQTNALSWYLQNKSSSRLYSKRKIKFINVKLNLRQSEGVDDEGDTGAVVRQSLLERRPWISAVGTDRVKERFDQYGVSPGGGSFLVPESVLPRRNRNLTVPRRNKRQHHKPKNQNRHRYLPLHKTMNL